MYTDDTNWIRGGGGAAAMKKTARRLIYATAKKIFFLSFPSKLIRIQIKKGFFINTLVVIILFDGTMGGGGEGRRIDFAGGGREMLGTDLCLFGPMSV